MQRVGSPFCSRNCKRKQLKKNKARLKLGKNNYSFYNNFKMA